MVVFFWRSLLIGILAGFLLSIPITYLEITIEAIPITIASLITIIVQVYFTKNAINRNYNDFRLSAISLNENQEKVLTLENGFQVWWYFFWRSLLVGILASFLLSIIIALLGITIEAIPITIASLITIIVQVYFTKNAINRNYNDFRLSAISLSDSQIIENENQEKTNSQTYNPIKDGGFWIAFVLGGGLVLPIIALKGLILEPPFLLTLVFLIGWTGWIIINKGKKGSLIIGFLVGLILTIFSYFPINMFEESRREEEQKKSIETWNKQMQEIIDSQKQKPVIQENKVNKITDEEAKLILEAFDKISSQSNKAQSTGGNTDKEEALSKDDFQKQLSDKEIEEENKQN